MKKLFIFLVSLFFAFGINAQLIISEIADGTGTGGYPKYVEVTNTGTSAIDLSAFKIRKSANGAGFADAFTFPAFSLPAGESYVVTNIDNVTSGQLWTDFNLTTPANVSHGVTNVNGNGDDAYALTDLSDNIIDIYGEELVDGTGSSWDYLDSYAYRNSTVTSPNTTFTQSEWTTAAPNTLDGQAADLSPYLTPGTHTFSSNDQTSTVTAPATQLPAGTISSIATDSVPVMRFDITDAASGDGLPTVVTGIYVVAGPNNTLDFQNNLSGGGIYDLTNAAVVSLTGQPTITSTSAFLPVNLTIPDGGTVSLEAYVYIDNTNAPDGGILQFQINAANHGFTADASGSGFEATFAGGDIAGNNFTVDVTATQFTFLTQPSDVVVNEIMSSFQVATTDAFGNVDIDNNLSYIKILFSGTGSMYGTSGLSTNNGICTYTDLYFNTSQTGVHLTANDGNGTLGFSDVNSADFNILSNSGGTTCADATVVDVGTHYASHTTTDDYDQWYVYTATADGTITVENCSSGYTGDTYLEIIEGDCAGTNWNSAEDVCGTLETLDFYVTAGNSYYIGWGDYNTTTPGQYSWTLSFRPVINITDAYAVSNNELVLKYESPLSSVNPSDYTLTAVGQTTVNFSNATIDATDNTIVYLTASSDFAVNTIRDNINDAYNNTSYQFYAGILPVSYTNTANDPDTIRQGYNATLKGVVTANDNFNQVWIQDSDNPKSGVMIYGSSFTGLVSVNDTVTFVGQKAFYNGLTEIINPMLITSFGGGSYTAAVVNTSDLDYNLPQDDVNAEQWEGQLVTVSNIVIDSLNSTYYEYYGHDCDGNIICFDDDVDYHYGSGFTLTTGNMYNITGVVTYAYGHYKINPRGTADATEIVRDFTSVAEAPATQVPDAVIDGTIATDSLNAVEVLRFKITDEGTDGLPTKLSRFDIYYGPNNTLDVAGNAIDGGWFDFGDPAAPLGFSAEPVFFADHVTFYVDPETAVIDNGTSKEIILHVWFSAADLVDESVLQLMIKADPHGFFADCTNSQFAGTFAGDIIGGSLTLDTNVGIKDISSGNIKIYPNPASGILHVSGTENINKISILNILGQTLKTTTVNSEKTDIDITKLNSGIYYIKSETNEGNIYVKQFIKK